MGDKYVPYAVEINATIIDQIESRSFDLGHDVQTLRADGNVDEQFVAVLASNPTATLTTTALSKALTVCGFDGLDLSSGCDIWFQKLADQGIRAGTLSHAKVVYSDGLLVPRRLIARQGQFATLEFEIIAVSSDGTTAPHSISTGATLAGSPATDEAFTLGPVSIAGSTLNGVTEVELDFGIEVDARKSDGGPYPKIASIMSRKPRIRFKTTDMDYLTGTDFQVGDPIPTSDTVFTFYQVAQNGTLTGSGDITVTVDEGILTIEDGGGDNDSGDMLSLLYTPTYDGTNNVLVIA